MVSIRKLVMSAIPIYTVPGGLLILDSNGDYYVIDGTVKLIDYTTGKIVPVEILGTNLPANTGLINSSMVLIGNYLANRLSIQPVPSSDYINIYYGTGNPVRLKYSGNINYPIEFGSAFGYGGLMISSGSSGVGLGWAGIIKMWIAGLTAISVASGVTIDGLDLSEYITAWNGNLKLVTCQAGGYTNCVAGDIGKIVTDDGTDIGILYAYDNTTRVWTVLAYDYSVVAAGSVMAVTAGTGAGTSTGSSTQAPAREQNVKTWKSAGLKLTVGGTLTVYLTDDGTAGGSAIFTKKPAITLGTDSGALPDKSLSADNKTLTLGGVTPGTASDPIDIIAVGEIS